MRTFTIAALALFLAGCATAPPPGFTQVTNHRDNTISFVPKSADSDFVGTSAIRTPAKATPTWYRYGHP
jgi:PBP1b-binding outer membrane lipoprotein LpoB